MTEKEIEQLKNLKYDLDTQIDKEDFPGQKEMFGFLHKKEQPEETSPPPQKKQLTKSKAQKPIPKKKLKITTARIIQDKLNLIKFVHNDLNAFEALDQVIDFWIEHKQDDIKKATNRMLRLLKQLPQ